MRLAIRMIAFVILAAGWLVLGADLLRSLERGGPALRSIAQIWALAGALGLEDFGARVDPGGLLLGQPAGPILILSGIALAALSRLIAPRSRRLFVRT